MAPQPDGQLDTVPFAELGVERADRLDDPQPRAHGALCVVLVGVGIAEEDQQAVAEILGDVTVEAGDHLAARLVVRPHDLAQLFGIELTRQRR